ncbi:alpha-hydroxy acid oxidase [Chitinasiproducens palmae]|uniref:(S)-mandelate dehydrogenase n=1 Tax=Chitinasiproducens palmae TaxID=1770053 RepID=A0A1H2PQ81_9BURK|nr:alpha-hydroxy acid oxidase [Chitinasiproducens palmae]SDV48978.1 (S)-mandelate dehydrogenase [Chitinasiproducens palmae]
MSLFFSSTRGFANVADYREAARRRLAKIAFDYLDGGAEDGNTLARNRAAFANLRFAPRTMLDVSSVSPATRLFDYPASAPFVVGPTGLNSLFWPKADETLAAAAAARGVPFALSSASTSLLEDVRAAAPGGELWMQIYVQKDRRIAESIMRRASAAGFSTLLVTVDTPVHGRRDHDVHNDYRLPLRVTPKLLADLLRHPHWAWQIARHGTPQLVNLARSLGETPNLQRHAAALARQMDLSLGWSDIAWLRKHWQGPLLIKGVMTVEDARLAHRHGADGIVLSNHGGRQLEGAHAPIEVLPAVADALGGALHLYLDSGVRRGADVVKAVALGARGVLLGRAPLYGLAARGAPGVAHVLSLLYEEIVTTMTLLGSADIETLPARLAGDSPGTSRSASPLSGRPPLAPIPHAIQS